jgi:hypothetical protein
MAVNAKTDHGIPPDWLIGLDIVRARLTALWLVGSGFSFMILVLQSLMGKYGDKTAEVWGWLLPAVMPTLSMTIAVLGYTALDPLFSTSVVRKTFFRIAFWSSVVYLSLVLLTILIQPIAAEDPSKAIEVMRLSNLWLSPFQGLVASALGVLFVSKQKREPRASAKGGRS